MAEDTDVARVAAVLRAPSIRYRSFGNAPVRAPVAADPPASTEPVQVETPAEPQWADARETPWPASEARWSVEPAESWAEPAPAPQWVEPERYPAPPPAAATVAPVAEPFQWADAPAPAEPSREWAVAAPPAYQSQSEWSDARPDNTLAPPPVAAPAVIRPLAEPVAPPQPAPVAAPAPAPAPSLPPPRSAGLSPTLLELGSVPPPPVDQAMPRSAGSPFPLIAALDLPSVGRTVFAGAGGAPLGSPPPSALTLPSAAAKAVEPVIPAARLQMPLVELLQFVAAIDTSSAAVAPR
jgi:hypothetical protein